MNEHNPNLGLCCNCEAAPATTIIMLNRRAPEPGKGWGCVVCGLPLDGALAVLCQGCADDPPQRACVGYAKDGVRVAIDELPAGGFDHDPTKHEGDE